MGDVYRRRIAGMTAQQIADDLGVPPSGFVGSYACTINAIATGEIRSRSPHLARQTAARVRKWLKVFAGTLSPSAQQALADLLTRLEPLTADETAAAAEEQTAIAQTHQAESADICGIYVYSLPHYLDYPKDPERGHTLYKVGRSIAIDRRMSEHGRITALPEDPVLLRIYPVDPAAVNDVERYFHTFLEDADHARNRARTAGSEWFLTTTKFLDRVAASKGLAVQVVVEREPATD